MPSSPHYTHSSHLTTCSIDPNQSPQCIIGSHYHIKLMVKTLLISLSALWFGGGCQVGDSEIRSWTQDERGLRQLATYTLDGSRPIELRHFGVRTLAQKRRYNIILSMYAKSVQAKSATDRNQTQFLTRSLLRYLKRVVTSKPNLEEMSQAAELAYILMSVNEARTEFKRDEHLELLKALSMWPIKYIQSQRRVVVPSGVKSLYVTPEKFLIALLHLAEREEASNEVFNLFRADVLTHIKDEAYVLRAHEIIKAIKSPTLSRLFAPLLLEMARDTHEHHPERITKAWFDALISNRNVTILRFLIEICRDRQAPAKLLNQAINQVMEITQSDRLEGELVPLLDRVITSKRAYPSLIFAALEWAWLLEERINLKSRLVMISPEIMLPVSGNQTQDLVHRFCDNLQQSRDRLRDSMQNILDDLKERADLWPARLIAVACVSRLYPDDFPRVIRRDKLYQKYYQKDEHIISAWRSDKNVTLSEIIQSYLSQLR